MLDKLKKIMFKPVVTIMIFVATVLGSLIANHKYLEHCKGVSSNYYALSEITCLDEGSVQLVSKNANWTISSGYRFTSEDKKTVVRMIDCTLIK